MHKRLPAVRAQHFRVLLRCGNCWVDGHHVFGPYDVPAKITTNRQALIDDLPTPGANDSGCHSLLSLYLLPIDFYPVDPTVQDGLSLVPDQLEWREITDMRMRERVTTCGTQIMITVLQGPPKTAWVVTMKEAHELVDCLCDAIEEAQGNATVPVSPFAPRRLKRAPAPSSAGVSVSVHPSA